MTLDQILVGASGFAIICAIYWFFFGKREQVASVVGNKIDVLVDGGYKPSVIKIKKGKSVTISLTRKDPSSCLEEFILPDFKISKFLPVDKPIEIAITPEKAGEFPFHCGMNMFHGKVIVE